jgi:hypothetical protein
VNGQEDDYEIALAPLRQQVMDGNFSLRPHALQHAVKEGFTAAAMLQIVLHGVVVEMYQERNRCLLCTNVMVEEIMLPLQSSASIFTQMPLWIS